LKPNGLMPQDLREEKKPRGREELKMADAATLDLISEEMRGQLGKVQWRRSSYPIAASDIRKWALAVHYPEQPPAGYLRIGAAAGEAPLTAPEEFNPFAWATPKPDEKPPYSGPGFLERDGGITPPPVNFIVNGGTDCEYGVPMHEGDVITAEFSVKSYDQKAGKRGPLLITETQERWTNQRGEMVRNTVMTLVRY
jgi:hypothetical protein